MSTQPTRRQLANCIRSLSMDAVEKAKSGHPGCPMGMADIAEVLWNSHLKFNPKNPNWANRDRFVLSNGHGSMLLYSLLHLTGYELSIDDLKNFRQLHSKTPGHPEYREAPGVETTTGPLGQGIANAVGMALAEQVLAAEFNKPDCKIIDNFTYVFMGDGCLMEGISHEVCSLAGTLGLGKLICFWDDNGISIDGNVATWFADNTPERFRAYGWQVIENIDGHDASAIDAAINQAKQDLARPTIICCKTQIGYGSPNLAGSEKTHGAPLGDAEIKLAKQNLAIDYPAFTIPKEYYQAWDKANQGQALESAWQNNFSEYKTKYPELAANFESRISGKLVTDFSSQAMQFAEKLQAEQPKIATRKASQVALDFYSELAPSLFGGSADLTGSNLTMHKNSKVVCKDNFNGNYLHYGVREFGMLAMQNGMALTKGFIPYGGTFLTFADYAKNAIRLAALMQIQNIFVFSHDSLGLGEDGPTHQPVEQLTMLRATPNLHNWRPADAVETAIAWQKAIEYQNGPTSLVLTRQGVPTLARDKTQLNDIAKGGYVIYDTPEYDAILIATGSEVSLAIEAAKYCQQNDIAKIRVVSMPCVEVFEAQSDAYKQSVLPTKVQAKIAIEAGASLGWHKYVGTFGKVIGLDQFGVSAKAEDAFNYFGFSVENIVSNIQEITKTASFAE